MRTAGTKFWLFITILVVFISASIAYVLWGYKWPLGTTVSYYINENTAQVADEGDAVRSATNSWSQINPSGLKLSYGGSTSVTTSGYNSSNTICWENEGDSGTLATAYAWAIGSTMIEMDMVFNDFYNWSKNIRISFLDSA